MQIRRGKNQKGNSLNKWRLLGTIMDSILRKIFDGVSPDLINKNGELIFIEEKREADKNAYIIQTEISSNNESYMKVLSGKVARSWIKQLHYYKMFHFMQMFGVVKDDRETYEIPYEEIIDKINEIGCVNCISLEELAKAIENTEINTRTQKDVEKDIKSLKKRIKHSRSPLERKQFEKELNNLYKEKKRWKITQKSTN